MVDEVLQEGMRRHYDDAYYNRNISFGVIGDYSSYCLKNIFSIYTPKSGERILDIGCGWGTVNLWLQKHGFDVFSIDYSEKSIEYCRKSAREQGFDASRFLVRNGMKTGFKNNSFDVVYLADIVEHLYRKIYLKVIKEVFRVLKPGGKLIIYAPNSTHFLEFLKRHNIQYDPQHVWH